MSSTKRGNEFSDRAEPSKQVKVEGGGGEGSPSNQSEAEKAAEAAGKSLPILYNALHRGYLEARISNAKGRFAGSRDVNRRIYRGRAVYKLLSLDYD